VTATPNYSGTATFTLPTADGTKTVYAWYKDAAGNVSTTASDTIVLDQTAPSNGALTATAGSGQAALSWAGFSDGGSGLATATPYKLVFQTGSSPATTCTNGTQLYQGTGTSYTHTGGPTGQRTTTGSAPRTGREHLDGGHGHSHAGPRAGLQLDEGSGTVLQDASGNGRHGTVVGATWVAGKWARP